MSEEMKEWAHMWGAKVNIFLHEDPNSFLNTFPSFPSVQVKLRNDMPDDMLKDAIETSRRIISDVEDFESQGAKFTHDCCTIVIRCFTLRYLHALLGLGCAEAIKNEFDARWSPHWHCVIGRNFGSFVTHETKNFIFFYLGDKAVMLFKAG